MPDHSTAKGDIARGRILHSILREGPRSVPELAVTLDLSYMAVKQHCLLLQRRKLVLPRKRPCSAGRPVVAYILGPHALRILTATKDRADEQLLAATAHLFGKPAPERVLFTLFQQRSEELRDKIKHLPPIARVPRALVLREEAGYLELLDTSRRPALWLLTTFASPWDTLQKWASSLPRLECDLLARALNAEVAWEPLPDSLPNARRYLIRMREVAPP